MRTNVSRCRILSLSLSLSLPSPLREISSRPADFFEKRQRVRRRTITIPPCGADPRSSKQCPRNRASARVFNPGRNYVRRSSDFSLGAAVTHVATAADRRGNGGTSRCMKDGRPVNCDRIIGGGRKVYCDRSIGCLGKDRLSCWGKVQVYRRRKELASLCES